MAANHNLKAGLVLASSLGKLIIKYSNTKVSSSAVIAVPASLSLPFKRSVHVSSYDKNIDEQLVPDYVINDTDCKDNKYWWPHPTTGVFGPETSNIRAANNLNGATATAAPSVLDQTAWFRSLELVDVDKPHHIG